MIHPAPLSDLDFSRYEVIIVSLVPAMINLGIFISIPGFSARNLMNLFFALFVLFIAGWQTGDGLARLSRTPDAALEWYRIGGLFLLLAAPFGVLFALSFTQWYKKTRPSLLAAILLLPTLFFIFCIQARLDEYDVVSSTFSYWIFNPKPTTITVLNYMWDSLCFLATMIIFWAYYFSKNKDQDTRRKSLLLAAGITLPVIGGIICEDLLPFLFRLDTIPITASLTTFFSITSLVAIKKYHMLDFSPKHQWDKIVDSMTEGILIVDNYDRIMFANRRLCAMTEYSFEEIKGKVAGDLFLENGPDKERMQNVLKDRANKLSGHYEIKMITRSGRRIWMRISGSPYTDDQGRVIGSIGVQTDITELKESELLLMNNELKLNKAQAVAHVGSWELDFATGKALWSDEALRMYGLPPEEKEHSVASWTSFIHPEDLERVKAEVDRGNAEQKDTSFRHRIVWRDGTVRHILSVATFQRDTSGKPTGLFGICHDITTQVIAEQSIIESENRTRAFINESPLAIYFVNLDTKKISYVNPAFCSLTGYSPEEAKQLGIDDLVVFEKDGIDDLIPEMKRANSFSNIERIWKRKDGTQFHVLASSFYIRRNDSQTVYVAAHDISVRKKAELALESSNQELETYIYKASHDLRGPLASIIGLTGISRREISDPASLRYLDMIETATKKLDHTLTELVKAMKVKEIESYSDEISFEEILNEVLARFEHVPGFSQVKVSLSNQYDNVFISSKYIVETIFQNMVENAIKYRDLNSALPYLRINVANCPGGVNMSFEDNGIGMDERIQKKVFEMYFRGTDQSKGSGLGLYLVKKGIDKLKGEVELSSAPGKGSRFTVKLPCAGKAVRFVERTETV